MTAQRPDDQLTDARARLKQSAALGSGSTPVSGQFADDASGRYWLITDERIRFALEVALATGRPLLVAGDPGTGKSSLARAVAETLDWRYLEVTVTSRTQAQDLLWEVDHLKRLKDAQLGTADASDRVDNEENYVSPGALWWAFQPETAAALKSRPADPSVGKPGQPAVVLLDELDKADPEVPDNLLGPLGFLHFRCGYVDGGVVEANGAMVPLVIATSNGERDLSPAFLRRCVKLRLLTPSPDVLEQIAKGHLGTDERSAKAVSITRRKLLDAGLVLPTAVFIDAARAARDLGLDEDSSTWSDIEALLLGED